MGRYQFLESTLVQMGLKDSWASNDWNSDTDFAQKYGIKTDNDFLQNEAAQEAVMTQYLNGIAEDANKLMPDYGNTTFIGIKGQPITVTQSGLIAAIHREGYPAVKNYFDTYDGGNTSGYTLQQLGTRNAAVEQRLREGQNIPY